MTDNSYIVIGRLGKPFGVQGFIKIYAETEKPKSMIHYQPWYIKSKKGWQEIKLHNIEHQRDNIFIGQIQGVETPEEAKIYSGKWIAVNRDQLPNLKKGEYYWSDLEGMTVINRHNVKLGIIDHLMETGSNDVLVVKQQNETGHSIKTRLLPFLKNDVVLNIDLKNKTMTVDWDENF
ncbi:MAG: ribosome maturation factor RimM [Gammaproteobacteria bacterium]|nr:ribosome maturation factor RimM [Gammaproteobacteria bacterium]